jgi:predicted nucleotide-binding protein
MHDAFRGSGEWPTFQYLGAQIWQEMGVEPRQIYYELSAGGYVRPSIDQLHGAQLRSETRVAPNLVGLMYVPSAADDLGRFVEVVRYLGQRAARFRPSSPTEVEACQVSSEELKLGLRLSAGDTTLIRQAALIRDEGGILWVSFSGPDGSGQWSLTLEPERGRRFNEVHTVIDFLDVQQAIHREHTPIFPTIAADQVVEAVWDEQDESVGLDERNHTRAVATQQTASRPSMFIGSSTEGLEIAQALQAELEREVDSTIWSQGVFGLGEGTLEALEARVGTFDFAALVLTPDDLVEKRGGTERSPRDNVVFEAGLFMGALGRRRVFLVVCRDDDLALPSDLAGITAAGYNRRVDGNLRAAVGPVATNLRAAMGVVTTNLRTDIDAAATRLEPSEAERDHGTEQLAAGANHATDLSFLVSIIDEISEQFLALGNGHLRGDQGRLYGALIERVRTERPENALVKTLSAPTETALTGVFATTAAEARAGLSVMRSALLSAS